VERVNVEALLAEALDSYRRSHQRAVTDDQIRKAVASHKTRTEAAAELGITTRQLQTRCRALGLLTTRNRKPTSSDTR
jgi:bacterioferritin-associated ferredoxin